MLTVVKNNLRFILQSIKCNFASILEYKKSFFIQAVFMFVNNFFFLIFWMTVFGANGGEIDGLSMNDILYLYALLPISFGIAYTLFGGSSKLGKYILEGGLDSFLVQPKNVILNVLVSSMDFAAIGDLIYGLVIGLFATNFQFSSYLLLIIFGIIGAIFFVCTECIIRLLTILIGNTNNIENVFTFTLLITFSNYPEAIFGKVTRFLIYTIIPSAYITHIPMRMIQLFQWKDLIFYILAILAYIGITIFIGKRLLKKYESGNQIAMKG